MTVVTVEEAQARLSQLIDRLAPGEELIITRDARPIAQLVGLPVEKPRPVPGRGRGKLVIVSEDDDLLNDFQDYMSLVSNNPWPRPADRRSTSRSISCKGSASMNSI